MNSSDLKLKPENFLFSAQLYPPKSHYKFHMRLGRAFPATKSQAKFFIQNGIHLDVLNSADITIIEKLLRKHNFKGDYKYTKSKTWVRLQNINALYLALKIEFDL
jgi:hypothetical protein